MVPGQHNVVQKRNVHRSRIGDASGCGNPLVKGVLIRSRAVAEEIANAIDE